MSETNPPKSKLKSEYNKLNEKSLQDAMIVEQIRRFIEGYDTKGNKIKHQLLPAQKKTLWKYYNSLRAGDSSKVTSLKSIVSYVKAIKDFGVFVKKPYKQVNKQNIIDYITHKQDTAEKKGKPLAKSTISYYRFMIKIFYRWLYQTGKKYPKIVAWIPDKTSQKRVIDENTLLSNSEIKEMVQKTDSYRDKCAIMISYEGALRVGELINIKVRDVKLERSYCEIKVSGKTGDRVLPLVDSQPYIEKWLNNHPFKGNKDSPLLINLSTNQYGRQIKRSGFRGILAKACERASIDKHVFPHLLRHSRLTHMASQGYNERDLRMYAGWHDNSDMPNVYLHYGYDGLKNKILSKKQRLTNAERIKQIKEQNANNPKECPRCGKENPSDALYCHCGMALDLRTVEKELRKRDAGDNILNKIVNDPELSKVFAELIQKAQKR